MIDYTKVFFQRLINCSSLSKDQRSKVLKMRSEYLGTHSFLSQKVNSPEDSTYMSDISDIYIKAQNTAELLSKFDKDNEYSIILYPDEHDGSQFLEALPKIQQSLVTYVQSHPIPNTLKALLYLFILGKYGPYREWIGGGGYKYSITCSSEQVKELCSNTHPIHIPELTDVFRNFGYAITVNSYVINRLLDVLEKKYCNPIQLNDNKPISAINKKMETPLDVNKPLSEQLVQRKLIRSNLGKVFFHTNTVIFFTALRWIFRAISEYAPLDTSITVSYEEKDSKSTIIVKHTKKNHEFTGEFFYLGKKLPNIIAGYGSIIIEAYMNKKKSITRIYPACKSSNRIEPINEFNNYVTYYLIFPKI